MIDKTEAGRNILKMAVNAFENSDELFDHVIVVLASDGASEGVCYSSDGPMETAFILSSIQLDIIQDIFTTEQAMTVH